MNNNKGSLVKNIFAWSGLALILIFILLIIYALMTKNGNLAFASIICLIILSVVYWIGILAYKRLTKKKELDDEMREKERIIGNSNIKTKNL